jgi:hypothetical protein
MTDRLSDDPIRLSSVLRQRDDVALIAAEGGVGIELGVAEGYFAERVLAASHLSHLYGVDMYAGDRGHNLDQYKRALRRLAAFRGRHTLLKMRFDEALDLFPDEHFDFVYVDGYAHDGEDGGKTFSDWYPKLRAGGVFAGDDYHSDWPLVVANVDRFLTDKGLELHVIACSETTHYSRYPTWFALKPGPVGRPADAILRERVKAASARFNRSDTPC